jgi:hypothetical protein
MAHMLCNTHMREDQKVPRTVALRYCFLLRWGECVQEWTCGICGASCNRLRHVSVLQLAMLHHNNVSCHAPFGEEPNCNHHPATIFSRSHSVQLLALPGTQSGRKFNVMQQQVAEPYQKRVSRGASSNHRTTGASVYVQKGSTSRVTRLVSLHVFFY